MSLTLLQEGLIHLKRIDEPRFLMHDLPDLSVEVAYDLTTRKRTPVQVSNLVPGRAEGLHCLTLRRLPRYRWVPATSVLVGGT